MNEHPDHAPWSELLRPYRAGELDEQRASAVRDHLDSCASCREELRAVEALGDPERLADGERAALRARVAAATASESRAARGGWGRRLAPALAAAAVVAVVLAGAGLVGLGGITGGGGGADTAEMSTEAAPDPLEEAEEGAGRASDQRALEPRFVAGAGELDDRELARLVRPRRVTVAQESAEGGSGSALQRLASKAPVEAVATQVRRCARRVVAGAPVELVPVVAATGTIEDRPIVAVGFLAADAGADARRVVWAWPEGTCAAPVRVVQR